MDHADALSLIAPGLSVGVGEGQIWADLGAGSGVFARALSELLGPTGVVIAVDRDARVLQRICVPRPDLSRPVGGEIRRYHADFRRPLELPPLDGLLLANSLHFVARQEAVLRQLVSYVHPQGRVLLVEYDEQRASPWNPYPVPPGRFKKLAAAVGLQGVKELRRHPSQFGNRELYTAVAFNNIAS